LKTQVSSIQLKIHRSGHQAPSEPTELQHHTARPHYLI